MSLKSESSTPPIFSILSLPDCASILEDWAGKNIFQRGLDYFKKGQVKGIVVTGDEKLLATVKGSRSYVSTLHLDEDGELVGMCTCPYDGICKHIVALALAAREAVLAGNGLPPCNEFDFRLQKLPYHCSEPMILSNQDRLKETLAKLSKDALLELLLKACALDRDVLLLCSIKADPDKLGLQMLIDDVKNAITEAASCADFGDYSSEPDYAAIAQKLDTLIVAGKPDIALHLAAEVFNSCSNAIEVYDEDCSIVEEVGEVASAAVAALHEIEWPLAKKMIWLINAMLEDEFGYCDGCKYYLDEISDLSAWTEVEKYLSRIQTKELTSWTASKVSNLYKIALKKSGKNDELLKIYESEAKVNGNYLGLINYLIEQGDNISAIKWIKKGIKISKSSYDIRHLCEQMIKIRMNEGNNDAVLAGKIAIFVNDSNIAEFKECYNAAKITCQWDVIRPLLFQYLINGTLPWLDDTWPCREKVSINPTQKHFPRYYELVEVALYENKPLEALKWYDEQSKNKKYSYGVSPIRLAEAIKKVAPERTFAIWREEVEKLISQTNSGSYFEAGRYLEKMIALSAELGDKDRWLPYLHTLREQHRRKRNFIKILDVIERGEKLSDNVIR